jgi:hypothetical protein
MTGNRAKIIVLAIFVLTLGAGVVAGMLASRLPGSGAISAPITPGEGPLTQELGLNTEQSEKMRKIWEGVRDLSTQSLRDGIKAEHQRDDAIRGLIPADKIEAFNNVQKGYQDKMAKMKGIRQAAFDRAVGESDGILTESQRAKYKEILEKRLGGDSVAGHDPLSGSAENGAASQP